ncbi:MAG: TonB-dependent receptor [Pseudomonadota bacterium]
MKAQPSVLKKRLLTTTACLLAASMAAPAVQAQDDDVIIVTTERREQNIQDVAATVQNFTGDDLQKLGINDEFSNLQYAVPGLQITESEGRTEVFLRGIGSFDAEFSSDPSVATLFNGIYIGRPRGIGLLFFDSARTEINKGPQGTVRGRNSEGGTINVISNRPEFEEFYGHVQAGFGTFNAREFEGVINMPITDTLAVRGAVFGKAHDSPYTNAFIERDLALDDFEGPAAQDDLAGRLSVLWEPTDRMSAYFLWQRSERDGSGEPGTFARRTFSAGFDIEDLDDPWNQYYRDEGEFDQTISNYIGQLIYEFDHVGVEYNASYSSTEAINRNASRQLFLGFDYPAGGDVFPGGGAADAQVIADNPGPNDNLNVNNTFYQGEDSKAIVQEVRFFQPDDSARLQWAAGAFYYKENFDGHSYDVGNGFCSQFRAAFDADFVAANQAIVGDDPVSCFFNGLGGEFRNDDSEVESIAGYGDVTLSVTDRLRVKGGIRYTSDEKTQTNFNAAYTFDFDETFFSSFPGIQACGDTGQPNCDSSDIVVGTQGLLLTPNGRSNFNVVPGQEAAFFLDGFTSFGFRDNFDDLLIAADDANAVLVQVNSTLDDPNTAAVETNSRVTNNANFIDWRAGLEFDITPDNLAYFTVSTGTRSGGINLPLVLADGTLSAPIFDEESLTLYELGSKNQFSYAGIPFTVNAAAFYYEFEDQIIQNLVDVANPTPGNPGATTQRVLSENVGSADAFGIEFEAAAALPYGLDLGINVLYLDAEYGDDALATDPRQAGGAIGQQFVNGFDFGEAGFGGFPLEGNQLQNTSKWNLNFRAFQEVEVNHDHINSFDWTLNLSYRTEFFLNPQNEEAFVVNGTTGEIEAVPLADLQPNNFGPIVDANGPDDGNAFASRVDDVFVLNAVVGVNFGEDDRFRLDGYVENATNQAFSGRGFINNTVNIRFLNEPRQYGARLRVKF